MRCLDYFPDCKSAPHSIKVTARSARQPPRPAPPAASQIAWQDRLFNGRLRKGNSTHSMYSRTRDLKFTERIVSSAPSGRACVRCPARFPDCDWAAKYRTLTGEEG